MCDCTESKTTNNKQYNFKIIAETLYPSPSIFTIEELSSRERFNLTAAEIFKHGYICDFTCAEIISIAYCYAQEEILKDLAKSY